MELTKTKVGTSHHRRVTTIGMHNTSFNSLIRLRSPAREVSSSSASEKNFFSVER